MDFRAMIERQFARPAGIVGRMIGWWMSVSGKQLSVWTVEKINARGTDRILEVGYGPGVTLAEVADQLSMGMITGVDHSETMYRTAQKRNSRHIARKKAFLRCGTIDDLGYPRMYFDTIYGANMHFYWDQPAKEFLKLRRLLKPEGKLLMVFQPRWAKTAGEIREMSNACRIQLEQAGFSSVKVELKRAKPVIMIAVTASTKVGRKPNKIVTKKFLEPGLQTERLD